MPDYSRRIKQRQADIKRRKIVLALILVITAIYFGYPTVSTYLDSQLDERFEFTDFFEANPDLLVITTDSGLQYQDLVVGDGVTAQSGDTVSVHYTGWLTNETKFDSSLDRGSPYEFALGSGGVILGWDEGVAGMRVGGTRLLFIPSELAYGEFGQGDIPPGARLIFKIELLNVIPYTIE